MLCRLCRTPRILLHRSCRFRNRRGSDLDNSSLTFSFEGESSSLRSHTASFGCGANATPPAEPDGWPPRFPDLTATACFAQQVNIALYLHTEENTTSHWYPLLEQGIVDDTLVPHQLNQLMSAPLQRLPSHFKRGLASPASFSNKAAITVVSHDLRSDQTQFDSSSLRDRGDTWPYVSDDSSTSIARKQWHMPLKRDAEGVE